MPAQIAFNAIPQIDTFQENGYTREEMKMAWETCKILQDDSIAVNATCVRIPVFYGHSEAVHIETRQPISVDDARAWLTAAPGVTLLGDHELATPVEHGAGTDPVFVSRLRKDISHPNGLICGWWRTTSARARHSTVCKLPSCSWHICKES